jgi:hypothetical protein
VAGTIESLRKFSQSPVGLSVFIALIVLGTAWGLIEFGPFIGAIWMILLGFVVPVYLGWKKSYKTMFLVVLVILVASPPVYAALYNNQLFVPYSVPSSSDNILQHASVNPFTYPPAKGNTYDFSIATYSVNMSGNHTRTTAVTLWITDCPNDGYGSNDQCGYDPDYLQSFPYYINATNTSSPDKVPLRTVNWAYWNLTLPSNKIMYFQFTANFTVGNTTTYGYSAIGYCTFSQGVCRPASLESAYWLEGPITGSWNAIFVTLLPSSYLLVGVLCSLLAIIIIVYRYLKIREKRRQEEAKAAASGTPTPQEARCSSCGAIMKKDETTCWKCGKLQSTPSLPPPSSPDQSLK